MSLKYEPASEPLHIYEPSSEPKTSSRNVRAGGPASGDAGTARHMNVALTVLHVPYSLDSG